jgi:hypothetical protein
MSEYAMAEPDWPAEQLEDPAIGIELTAEVRNREAGGEDTGMAEGSHYFGSGLKPGENPDDLAGTAVPGDIHIDLTEIDNQWTE